MANKSLRAIILQMTEEVLFKGAASDALLNRMPEPKDAAEERDQRFIRLVFRGILERRPALDFCIRKISSVPFRKIEQKILCILYIGIYQLLFMEGADHAAVSECVRLTQEEGHTRLKGYVNAVLRNTARRREELLSEMPAFIHAGIPDELYQLLVKWHGQAAADGFAASLENPDRRLSVRRNSSKITEEAFLGRLQDEGIQAEASGYTDDSYLLSDIRPLRSMTSFREGLFYVQDLSSILDVTAVSDLLTACGEDFRILDACASPGGKSLHAADLMHGRGSVLACDVSEEKLQRIRENIETAGFRHIRTEVRDASLHDPALDERFDLVIADVPCSGIGTIRRKPEIRYRIREEQLRELCALQQKILDNLSHYVRPGGTLLYSTCTVNPEENETAVRYFLDRHTDYHPQSFGSQLPESLREQEAGRGMLQLLPSADYPGTGFFIARLKKEEA